jgi:hypothetical protein
VEPDDGRRIAENIGRVFDGTTFFQDRRCKRLPEAV